MTNATRTTRAGARAGDARGEGRTLLVLLAARADEHRLPDEGTVVLGRARDADVRIDDPTLSRAHARLVLGAHVTIEDLGSRNGTRVGGHALRAGEPVLVAPGSAIEVGDVLVVVRGTASADLLASTDASEEESAALDRAVAQLARAAIPVLVAGEPGVGKAHVAARLHRASRRRGALVVLSCSPSTTAAAIARAVADAHDGTLVVREPMRLDPRARAALDSALAAMRGRDDVRVVTVARTAGVPEGLRSRLASMTVVVPPLRVRLRELPRLVEELVVEIAAERGEPPRLVGAMALARLGRHTWPGNVRELRDVLRRAMASTRARVIAEGDITIAPPANEGPLALVDAVADAERTRILEALRRCDGNQTRAAKLLGISRGTLVSRLERYAMPRPRK